MIEKKTNLRHEVHAIFVKATLGKFLFEIQHVATTVSIDTSDTIKPLLHYMQQ